MPDPQAVAALHAMPPIYVPPDRGSPVDRAVAEGRADPMDHGPADRAARLARTRGSTSGGGALHAAPPRPLTKALVRRIPAKPPVSLRHRAGPDPGRSRRVRIAAVAGLAGIVVAGTAAVAVGLSHRGAEQPPSTLSVANKIGAVLEPAAGAGADPADRRAPHQVRLQDTGETVTVSWADPAAGPAPIVVAVAPAEQQPLVEAALQPGTKRYELRGLDPKREYCVVVASYFDPDDFVPSTAACTRRRAAAPASGSR